MEFHIVRQELLSELQLMMGVIEKKNTMPILANFYILAEDNELTLKATDLEVGIITKTAAQVIEPGEITVNAKNLLDMLNSFSDAQASFSMSENSMLDISCGSAQFSIETMSTLDYPTIPECNFNEAIRFQNGFFNDCISKILFSVSSDPHKYALNGALLFIENGEMNFVSTDGHRMSVITKTLGEGFPDLNLIIPRKSLVELKKSIQSGDDEDEFMISVVESRIFFKVGARVLFSRLIDGKFPDYTKAIPSDNNKSFSFERSSLLHIVRRKIVLSNEKSKLVRMSFKPGELVVVLKNSERGESVDRLALDYDDEPIDVGFNVDYVHDFLKNMNNQTIEINIKDEANQGLFRVIDEDIDFEYKHIIMPMRLTG